MFGILYIKNYLFYYSSQLFYNFFFLPNEIYPLCFTPFFLGRLFFGRVKLVVCFFYIRKEVGESESERERERERERVREG